MQLSQVSKWIWAKDCPYDVNCYAEFAGRFTVHDTSAETNVRISADSQYAMWINGQFSDMGQYADYPEYKIFDTIDITKLINAGENEIRIIAYYQGTDSSTYRKGAAGLLFDIVSGNNTILVSDASILSRTASEFKNGPMEFVTGQLGYSFAYDATNKGKNPWQNSAVVSSDVNVFPRPIAKLDIMERTPASIVAQGFFMHHPAYRNEVPALKMQKAFLSSAKLSAIVGCNTCAPYRLAPDHPLKCLIDQTSQEHLGENGVYVIIDIGGEEAGYFDIDIEAAEGTEIYIGYGEHLIDLRVSTYVGGRCFAAKYTCAAGRNKYTHYNKRFGCRYISLYIESFDFTLYYAGIRPGEYPFADSGTFTCSDMLHNKIHEVCRKTLRLSAHEHYEDCPWREQSLYSMDSRNQMLCGYYAFGEYDMPRESLRLLAYGQRGDGLLELCAPARVGVTIPSFTLIWILELYEYVFYSGDIEFAQEMWPYAEKIIHAFWRNSKGRDLQEHMYENGCWNFYEWAPGLDNGYPVNLRDKNNSNNFDGPLSAFYIAALECMIKMAKLIYSHGKTVPTRNSSDDIDYVGKISWCEMLLSGARSAFHDTFWDNETGAYCTYVVNGEKLHFSELMNSLALYIELVPEQHVKRVAGILSGKASCTPELVPVTLSYAIFKYEALMSLGGSYADYVMSDIADKWGYMLYNNATSFWETINGPWDFDNAGSLCHGWSAIPIIIYYKYILGVSPKSTGFADYNFKPVKLKTHITASGRIPRLNNSSLDVEIGVSENKIK